MCDLDHHRIDGPRRLPATRILGTTKRACARAGAPRRQFLSSERRIHQAPSERVTDHVVMKYDLNPSLKAARNVSARIPELADWYASHAAVRHVWAIAEREEIRIVVTLEPTLDGDDTQPIWLANSQSWVQELRWRMNRDIRLELIHEPWITELQIDTDSVVFAEYSWRDPGVLAFGP